MFIRIYVASLTDYNSGYLHGVWIDCEGKDADDIQEEVNAMLAESPTMKKTGKVAEEWAIHDHEGFGSNLVGKYTSFAHIAELAEIYDQCSDDEEWVLFNAFWESIGSGAEPSYDDFQEAYCGTYRDLGDWAAEINKGCFNIPEALQNYIDWEAMGHDAELNGDIFKINLGYGKVAVFWNR